MACEKEVTIKCEYKFDRKSARFVDQLFQELRKPFFPFLEGEGGKGDNCTAPAYCTKLWCGTIVLPELFS